MRYLGAVTPFSVDNSTDQGAFSESANISYSGGIPSFADAQYTLPAAEKQLLAAQQPSGGLSTLLLWLAIGGALYWYFIGRKQSSGGSTDLGLGELSGWLKGLLK